MSLEASMRHHQAQVAALSRDRAPDDPVFIEARRNLKAMRLYLKVQREMSQEPPLTPEQIEDVVALLLDGGKANGHRRVKAGGKR